MAKRIAASHLTVTQAAKFVGVSQPSVTEALQAKRIPFVIVFGVKMIYVPHLEKWRRERGKLLRELKKEQPHGTHP